MAKRTKRSDPKTEALRRQSSLHPHPESVTDPLFEGSDFFDARDLVQVKYEMLRRVRVEARPITESASAFGLSRPSFYQAQSAFELGGLGGLLPKKPGPRRAHKLSAELVEFLEQLRLGDPSLRPADLAERVLERFELEVHPRSIERALARLKKKRP
jgi:transposase